MAFLQTNYLKRNSVVHDLSPVVKLSWILLVIVLFVSSNSIILFIVANLVIIVFSFIAKVGKNFLRGLLFMLAPIFLFSLIIHGLFNPLGTGSEKLLFSFFSINATVGGLNNGLFYGFKIASLISIFYLFILTTYPGRMVNSLLLLGMPYKIGFLVNSTLQIVPLMLRDAETILDAQRARGLETRGNLWNRLNAYVPLIGPLVIGNVMRVYERTIALEVRGFNIKCVKTSLNVENFRTADKLIIFLSLVLIIIYLVLRVIGWLL